MLRKYQYGIWHCKLAHFLRSNSTYWEGELRRRKKQTPRAALAISACGVGKRPSPHRSKQCFARGNYVKSFPRKRPYKALRLYVRERWQSCNKAYLPLYLFIPKGMKPNYRLGFKVPFPDILSAMMRFISLFCIHSRTFFHNSAPWIMNYELNVVSLRRNEA